MIRSAVIIVIIDGSLRRVTRVYDEINENRVDRAAQLLFAKELFACGINPTVGELEQYIEDGHAEWNDRLVLLTTCRDCNAYKELRGSVFENPPETTQEYQDRLEELILELGQKDADG